MFLLCEQTKWLEHLSIFMYFVFMEATWLNLLSICIYSTWSILPLTAILFIKFLQNHCIRRIPGYYGSNLAENSTHAKYSFCEDRSSLSAYLESNLQITNSLFARSIFILFLMIFVMCKQNVYDQSQKTVNKFCKTAWNRMFAAVPYLFKNCRNLPKFVLIAPGFILYSCRGLPVDRDRILLLFPS